MELLTYDDVVELLGARPRQLKEPWSSHGILLNQREPSWPTAEDWIDRSALPLPLADHYDFGSAF